jgi:hypothetical protein
MFVQFRLALAVVLDPAAAAAAAAGCRLPIWPQVELHA